MLQNPEESGLTKGRVSVRRNLIRVRSRPTRPASTIDPWTATQPPRYARQGKSAEGTMMNQASAPTSSRSPSSSRPLGGGQYRRCIPSDRTGLEELHLAPSSSSSALRCVCLEEAQSDARRYGQDFPMSTASSAARAATVARCGDAGQRGHCAAERDARHRGGPTYNHLDGFSRRRAGRIMSAFPNELLNNLNRAFSRRSASVNHASPACEWATHTNTSIKNSPTPPTKCWRVSTPAQAWFAVMIGVIDPREVRDGPYAPLRTAGCSLPLWRTCASRGGDPAHLLRSAFYFRRISHDRGSRAHEPVLHGIEYFVSREAHASGGVPNLHRPSTGVSQRSYRRGQSALLS